MTEPREWAERAIHEMCQQSDQLSTLTALFEQHAAEVLVAKPDGAPREPTKDMVSAARLVHELGGFVIYEEIWQAMYDAAPQQPSAAVVSQLSDIDHEWFGSWLDAGPSMYDQYQTDTARLAHTLHCIKGYREAVHAIIPDTQS